MGERWLVLMGRHSLYGERLFTAKIIVKPLVVKPQQMLTGCEIWVQVPGVKAFTLPTAQIATLPKGGSGVLVVAVLADILCFCCWGMILWL